MICVLKFTVSRICAAVSVRRSRPKTKARYTKISSPASKFVAPILGPWYMRFAFCKKRVELRQVASFIHVFLRLVPGCWFHMQGTQWRKAKSMQAHSPKNGPASQRKRKEHVESCRDARAVLKQACEVELWLPLAMQRHVHSQRQCTGPWAQPRHPQTSKLTYFRTLQSSYTRKGIKTGFCEWQRWFLGSGAMFACAYLHTSRGSSFKLAIRIGLAAKLLRLCSKATKHCVAFPIGSAAKLLRMRSKATKDNFAIRIGRKTTKKMLQRIQEIVSSAFLQVWGTFLVVLRPSHCDLQLTPK